MRGLLESTISVYECFLGRILSSIYLNVSQIKALLLGLDNSNLMSALAKKDNIVHFKDNLEKVDMYFNKKYFFREKSPLNRPHYTNNVTLV